ncbi:MAG: hypothetical protein N3E45_14100 [Oscillatoriaceae bacterium SKW80]|nr:hypothetical protein [Oscillatoriaceae bacterium SKYG93]MCX8121932.1 hypothetical protein [Oscillatoriaceae bacterium SKW80]MDW8454218.1 hypothetical protein [Oscillatoriaceae cyanobacterium SKYGB_i_bin93]
MAFSGRFYEKDASGASATLILAVVVEPFVNFSRTVLAQDQTSVAQGEGQNIIIHLTHSTDDLHAAFMAL